jgi:dynein heavy chain 2
LLECETAFPDDAPLSAFQRVLFTQALRPDRLLSSISAFVCDAMRLEDLSPPPLSFPKIYEASSTAEPVLFIAQAGADPTAELEAFAMKTLGGTERFTQMAMGSGQTDAAMDAIKEAARDGAWVCLKNLHLVTDWVFYLEKALKGLSPHDDFRLWLTTEPHDNFPTILLQQSRKISYESPPGLKQNMLRTYESWDAAYIARGPPQRAQLLFVLAWFHALVQERRVFIPQGWTKFYEFSEADLRSGGDTIDALFASSRGADIDFITVWGLMKFAIYGGRIDNDHDVRILYTYLVRFFHQSTLAGQRQLTAGLPLPSSNDRDDYVRAIDQLPSSDSPAQFSLAANVGGNVERVSSSALIAQLRKLAMHSALVAKFDRAVWRAGLAPLLTAWQQLTGASGGKVLQPHEKTASGSGKDGATAVPIDSFVLLECEQAHALIKRLDADVVAISNVVHSGGLLTPHSRKIGTALLAGGLPWEWEQHFYGPDNAIAWLKEVAVRVTALHRWAENVRSGRLLQSPLRLDELFRPRVFLNALRQQTARETGVPIDSLRLTCAWERSMLPRSSSAAVGVAIQGMHVQGCSFRNNMLDAVAADAPTLTPIPDCYLAYVANDAKEIYSNEASLTVPVYYSATRETFVCELRVPCRAGAQADSILAGVCLTLSSM